MTIRGRILIAFLIMSMITAALGGYATFGIKDAGILVDKTFDESLMSINYARSAATDFAAMRAAFARLWIATDSEMRAKLNDEINRLTKTIAEDLAVAVQRSQSRRAKQAAADVQRAVTAWANARERLLDKTKLDVNWETLDQYAHKVDEQIDLLVNYTAGDGFIYRQMARATVARDLNLNVIGTIFALLLSALVAWALARRIVKPVADASSVAEWIAAGKLDVVIPKGSADELGVLFASMGLMRDNLKAMMEREVALRRTAQAHLADALESSKEGVVLVDANDCIALANAQAADFLGVPSDQLKPGMPLADLRPSSNFVAVADQVLRRRNNNQQAADEVLLPDGRWLRVSHSATRDKGFIFVCSDISLQKMQEANLRQTNSRLDIALENMSQGLCMFDASQRLIVCNNRYAELYGLNDEQTKPGTELRTILEYRIARGSAPDDPVKYTNDRICEVMANKPYKITNRLQDGRYICVVHRPMEGGGWVATHEDITEQRRSEQELDDTKRFLNSIIENIPMAVVVKDAKTRKSVLVNRACEAMFGLARSELLGKTVFEVYDVKYAELIDKRDTESLQGLVRASSEDYEVEIPQRGTRIHATNRIVMCDAQGDAKYLIAVIDDVTERKKSEQRIAFMAHHDSLTGLANRAALAQRIEEAAAHQRRHGDPFTILLLDLDRFKFVNDTLGHPAGDALLRESARRLKGFLRETDVLARLGGDEFAIIQAGEANQGEGARALADRIIDMLSKPFNIDGHEVNIGTSIGIALAPEHGTNPDDLLKMADLALYRAKSSGRNGYRFFDPEMGMAANERHELENELRHAIQQGQLELHYQPIIDTKMLRICGAEALVRWRHPTKGMIFPDQFIPLAEETGLISQIGEWVLHTACVDAATWPAGIKVAVNLSPVQFRKGNLSDVVLCALAQSGLAPERLELEITETALIESATECLPALLQFKDLGIAIALDDFGTGYSSLSQLTMFPIDKIKIDKSFTQNLTKRTECAAIISATLTLAQSLNIATTAEGVETVDQCRLLRLAGVTSLQGHLFKRPCPASEIDFEAIYSEPRIEDAA